MAINARLYVEDSCDERRAAPRLAVGRETTLRRSGVALGAVLHDLSSTGASVETSAPLAVGTPITIGLAGVGRFAATVVSVSDTRAGCRFNHPLGAGDLDRAFAGDPVTVADFGAETAPALAAPPVVPYPGWMRLALPIGGAVGGWTLILHAARAALG